MGWLPSPDPLQSSAEGSRYVGFGLWDGGRGENSSGGSVLDQFAQIEERRLVGTAAGLGQIVRHDDNRELPLQFEHQLLDFQGRQRIKR